jgi:hypothetical protein
VEENNEKEAPNVAVHIIQEMEGVQPAKIKDL